MRCRPFLPAGILILVLPGVSQVGVFAAEPSTTEPSAAEAKERVGLTGIWRGYAVDGRGEKPDQGPVKLELTFSERTIKGIEFKGDEPVDHGEGDYLLDLAAEPRRLDGSKSTLSGRKDVWMGIYKVEGDKLYWCVAKRERPTSFETVKGQFLMILNRDKPATPRK
jgi:uncharacterized protein (TIGR03067 family)